MVAAVETEKRYSPDDFLKLPDNELYELVEGRAIKKPAFRDDQPVGLEGSSIITAILARLSEFVKQRSLGHVVEHHAGFCYTVDGDQRIRRPDVAFIRRGKLISGQYYQEYSNVVPDLVVEVISRRDTFAEVQTKVEEYLTAGVQLIWVVTPSTRTVLVFEPQKTAYLHENDLLTGGEVLPDFAWPVAEMFPPKELKAWL